MFESHKERLKELEKRRLQRQRTNIITTDNTICHSF